MTKQMCVRTYEMPDYYSSRKELCSEVNCKKLNTLFERGWKVVFATPKADYIEYILEREVDTSRME